jgi:hypothetical protein
LSKVLSAELEARLTAEVTDRTSMVTTDLSQIELKDPYRSLEGYADANPDSWYGAMGSVGVTQSNGYKLPDDTYLVLKAYPL